LDLWKQRLGEVPAWVWERTELETLVLADNELTEVSAQVSLLRRLRMLDLGHNFLAAVPEALGELEGLMRGQLEYLWHSVVKVMVVLSILLCWQLVCKEGVRST
jgi:hypothetical protein